VSDYFDRIERQLVTKVETGVAGCPRSPLRFAHLGYIVAMLVVIAVVVVFLGVRGPRETGSPPGADVVFSVTPLDPRVPLGPSIKHSIAILGHRLDQVLPGVQVRRAGSEIVVTAPNRSAVARIIALSVPGSLDFYDWEANALITSGANAGKTVASRLQARDPTAVLISQGSGPAAPGGPGAGSVGLYQAVELAHRQPVAPSARHQSHLGAVYYLFGTPGSAACRFAAQAQHTRLVSGEHCLLAGPESRPMRIAEDLAGAFNGRVTPSQGQLLTVPRGTVVIQAVDANQSKGKPINSPLAQFYVLKDNFGLQGTDIVDPEPSTDQAGRPDVHFSFTSKGQKEFSTVTNQISKRGFLSPPRQTYNQHFAVALDGKLITVPSIDYHIYPDGINGLNGADISGGFTRAGARDLAALLRFGPLPVKLVRR
jgi:SecD/SecF fusion protein